LYFFNTLILLLYFKIKKKNKICSVLILVKILDNICLFDFVFFLLYLDVFNRLLFASGDIVLNKKIKIKIQYYYTQ